MKELLEKVGVLKHVLYILCNCIVSLTCKNIVLTIVPFLTCFSYQYKDDPQFAEFMETHLGKNNLWSNDVVAGTGDGPAVTEEVVEELKNNVLNSIPDEDLAKAKISDFEVHFSFF